LQGLQAERDVAGANGADDYALLALDGVDLVTEFLDALADGIDFFFGGIEPHGDDHGRLPGT